METIEAKVREDIRSHRLVQPGDRVVVGVSGGADSVALLFILNHLSRELGFSLSVCHLNHHLRGQDSDTDEVFVKNLCAQFGLPSHLGHRDVRAIQEQEGGTLEETARRARYDFFKEAAVALAANRIALAHHRDDQAETILFNMIRGSSFHGLRGIPLIRPIEPASDIHIIRPLLEVSKTELETYLESRGICWRTDLTNFEYHADRNFLRLKVFPLLEEINPSFREHLAELGRQAGAIEDILADPVQRALAACKRTDDDIRLEQWRLKSLPEIVASEVVRGMFLTLGAKMGRLGARHFRDVVNLSTSMELPDGYQARVEHGWLVIGPRKLFEKNDQIRPLPVNGSCRFARFEFSARLRDFDDPAFKEFLAAKTHDAEWIDADKVEGELSVRYARDGDRFWPLGAPGTKKISDFLTDVKAGWAARPATVVADEKGIVWLTGWRVDDRVKITSQTRKILQLKRS